jgi:hypothetical protein
VIIDPIARYIDAGLDMAKNNEMRLILQPLITLAHELNVAILVIYTSARTANAARSAPSPSRTPAGSC